MASDPKANQASGRPGVVARTWRRLRGPSARWSVFALVAMGFVLFAGEDLKRLP